MAPLRSIHKVSCKPSFSQFLIALYLVKSKPSNLSVQEYISSLRSYIKEGNRPGGSIAFHNHIDTSAFWRDSYKKSEEAQVQLRAKIFELEQVEDARKDSVSRTPPMKVSQGKRKRHAIESSGEASEYPPKRLKAISDDSAFLLGMTCYKYSVDDVASLISDQNSSSFVHRFHLLQRLLSLPNPDNRSLALLLPQICSDIRQIAFLVNPVQSLDVTTDIALYRTASKAQRQNAIPIQADIDPDIHKKFTTIGRLFPCLLQSVRKLSQMNQENNFESRAIYHFVELFRDLLKHICALSIRHMKYNGRSNNPQKGKKTIRAKTKVTALQISSQTLEKSIKFLCYLLNTFISALDTSITTDKQILEGFLFFLLHHVGTTLKIFVFGSNDTSKIISPNPIPPISSAPLPQTHEEERQHAEAQAPYLIPILSQAIHIAAHQPNPTPSSLQSTLLTALFGPVFPSALPKPLSPDPDPNLNTETEWAKHEDGIPGWFKSEVWRIVGWDLLSGFIAWE